MEHKIIDVNNKKVTNKKTRIVTINEIDISKINVELLIQITGSDNIIVR